MNRKARNVLYNIFIRFKRFGSIPIHRLHDNNHEYMKTAVMIHHTCIIYTLHNLLNSFRCILYSYRYNLLCILSYIYLIVRIETTLKFEEIYKTFFFVNYKFEESSNKCCWKLITFVFVHWQNNSIWLKYA